MQKENIPNHKAESLPLQIDNTTTNYSPKKTIIELFEQVVKNTPKTIAIKLEAQSLSYKELNDKANQLARYLRKRGVKEEAIVGVCLDISLNTIISIFAVLKAGAAYLILDPSYPSQRLQFMSEDASIKEVITNSKTSKLFQHIENNIVIEEDWKEIEQESKDNLTVKTLPENLMYVIYTSGSTGRPKGVCCSHKSIINLLLDFSQRKQITIGDTGSVWTSLSFDVSVYEIFSALTVGATLVLSTEEVKSDSALFIDFLAKEKITSAYIPAFMLIELLGSLEKDSPKFSLKRMLVGVEPIKESLLISINRLLPELKIINGYGPTETTICTTLYDIDIEKKLIEEKRTPIGKPIINTQVYILNKELKLVEIGQVGEVYISGEGLSRGYINNPDLTAERFIPNPFSRQAGERLYFTGDLARCLPDGNIEFVGRLDNQVKVRGFRIELAEIETVLNSHPKIQQGIVLVEETSGDKKLNAYLELKANMEFSREEIKAFLLTYLPSYMLPNKFIKLAQIPVTSNGKIDRKALLLLNEALIDRPKYRAPVTEEEKILANIWESILGIEKVGALDNFFHLGGHSLLATTAVSQIRSRLGVDLSLSKFFRSKTLEELAKQSKSLSSSSTAIEKITSVKRDQPLPLSFSQERVWLIQQIAPKNLAYTFHAKLHLKGNLNINILERCFNTLIERHEIFRTTFSVIDEEPKQTICKLEPINLSIVDLCQTSPAEKASQVEELIERFISKNFDISKLYLIDWLVLRLDNKEYILIHSEHHLVHDGWSFNLFLKELVTLYNAYYFGKEVDLPELKLQFADFAVWQREWLKGEAAKAELAYWRENLAGSPPLLVLPYDHPRPSLQLFEGGSLRQELSAELCESLRSLSRQEDVTLFMTMFAVFVVLLYRYSGQQDILIGSAIGNRHWQDVENIIGMFVNNIVLRTKLSESMSFLELLKQVRNTTLNAYENQGVPFDKVVEELNPERSLSYLPLCQMLFSFHDSQIPKLEFPEVEIELTEGLNNGSAKYDLDVVAVPRFEQSVGVNSFSDIKTITLIWEYNTELFERTTIERMASHYLNLLSRVLVDRDNSISQQPLLSEVERNQILFKFNEQKKDYPLDKLVHQLFEEQALAVPSNIAAVFGEQSITYSELNEKANQLSYYFRELGVNSGSIVGIYIESSLEMVIAIVASLKSGITYVPLNLSYPKDKLTFIIQDLKLALLITGSNLKEKVSYLEVNKLYLDKELEKLKGFSKHNPKNRIYPQEIAYIIYTSGSTGQPKGVMVTQIGIANLMTWLRQTLSISPQDAILQHSAVSFDISIEEFYLSLVSGSKLVLTQTENRTDVIYLLKTIDKYGVTVLVLVPSLLAVMVEEPSFSSNKLRVVISGGEALSCSLQEEFFKNSKADLYNSYGPTETSVDATYWKCDPKSKEKTVPIGSPIGNSQCYILDKRLEPVPIGVTGYLYVTGINLARGYYNHPSLTAERFIPNPFSDKKGERLYFTGDLARYLPDGNIDFIGRDDFQVKIRGFRIELGEVEAALIEHPAVKQVVVGVKEDRENKYLVAYWTSNTTSLVSEIELSSFLKDKLPTYMIPNNFVLLKEFPKGSTGKIDLQALINSTDIKASQKEFFEPKTDTEKLISRIWAQLLNLSKVGLLDNLFDLGGNSLLASKIITRLRKQSGVELALRDIFENPTVKDLAEVVERKTKLGKKIESKSEVIEKANISFKEDMLNKINEMSDKEVEELLKQMSKRIEN